MFQSFLYRGLSNFLLDLFLVIWCLDVIINGIVLKLLFSYYLLLLYRNNYFSCVDNVSQTLPNSPIKSDTYLLISSVFLCMYSCFLQIMLVLFLPISVSTAFVFQCLTALAKNFSTILNGGVYTWFSCVITDLNRKTQNISKLSVMFVVKLSVNILYQIKTVPYCFTLLMDITKHWILSITF